MPVSLSQSNLRVRVACATLVVLMASALMPACQKPPKPRELQELDVMWQDPETRRIKDVPGARGYYDTARKFRVRAQEAYNDGDLDNAREYAVWSVVKYRTAEAIASQQTASERLNKANAMIDKINPELNGLNQERNKLIAEVGDLEMKVAQAKRAKAERERRAAALNSGGTGTVGKTTRSRRASPTPRSRRSSPPSSRRSRSTPTSTPRGSTTARTTCSTRSSRCAPTAPSSTR